MSDYQRGLRKDARREKILALAPFCQDVAALSVGILALPRPGLARRPQDARDDAPASSIRLKAKTQLRHDA